MVSNCGFRMSTTYTKPIPNTTACDQREEPVLPLRNGRTSSAVNHKGMKFLDEQERLIVRQLIRDPRESDNGIGETTGVNVRTVGRKRQRLEQAGILSYFTHLDLSATGTGEYNSRHLYIIKFRI